jgi:hypothetical protein
MVRELVRALLEVTMAREVGVVLRVQLPFVLGATVRRA